VNERFPLERVCSRRSTRVQLTFAQEALEILTERPDCSFDAANAGLIIRGETEAAVSRPVEILKSAFAEDLQVGELTVRYLKGGAAVEEPHMGLRVSGPHTLMVEIRADLDARGATILRVENERHFSVIRATAPLVLVLGYTDWLAAHSGRKADVVMWLSHYAPVGTKPPPSAA
jgi:hypothetical protein